MNFLLLLLQIIVFNTRIKLFVNVLKMKFCEFSGEDIKVCT